MNVLETLPTVIGTAAVAPALLVLWLVVAADEHPVPPLRVWTAFLLGVASISLLGLARAPFAALVAVQEPPWLALPMRALFGVAAPEELVKIAVIFAVSTRRALHTDPMDAAVYGAAAGLGFAAYENLVYLNQFPEMWQSLALVRSVLTVPFHGALGVIAGCYIAIARAGGALGAHAGGHSHARWRAWLLIPLAPLTLHAAFDIPLLTLQQHPEYDAGASFALEATSMVLGFGTIVLAARLVRRIGRHHAPRTEISRTKLQYLRGLWALMVFGGGASFAGAAFLLSNIRDFIGNPDRNMKLVTIPIGTVSILLGVALLTLAGTSYVQGRNRLRRA